MRTKAVVTLAAVAALGVGALAPVASSAKGFGDFMNPSKWFGGGRDYDHDYYRGGSGYGYPGYGYGYPGYGYPGYGWGGVPPYGLGYPGYGYPPQVAPAQPSQGSPAPAAPPPPQ
jgi:hypothetical protein